MKKFTLLIIALSVCGVAIADTITINWGVDNQPYTTTTCEVGGDVVLPSVSKRGYVFRGWQAEHFDRGTFANWGINQLNTTIYKQDIHGNHIPLIGDYIIIEDASDYPVGDFSKQYSITVSGGGVYTARTRIYDDTGVLLYDLAFQNTAGKTFNIDDKFSIFVDGGAKHGWVLKAISHVKCDETIYLSDQQIKRIERANSANFSVYVNDPIPIPLSGTWKFVYDGVWEVDGKNGWKPVEQISNE